jgi:hypothetical protein
MKEKNWWMEPNGQTHAHTKRPKIKVTTRVMAANTKDRNTARAAIKVVRARRGSK